MLVHQIVYGDDRHYQSTSIIVIFFLRPSSSPPSPVGKYRFMSNKADNPPPESLYRVFRQGPQYLAPPSCVN